MAALKEATLGSRDKIEALKPWSRPVSPLANGRGVRRAPSRNGAAVTQSAPIGSGSRISRRGRR